MGIGKFENGNSTNFKMENFENEIRKICNLRFNLRLIFKVFDF